MINKIQGNVIIWLHIPFTASPALHDKLLGHLLSNIFSYKPPQPQRRKTQVNYQFTANGDLSFISTFISQIHRKKNRVKRNEREKCTFLTPNWRQQCYCFQSAPISVVQSGCILGGKTILLFSIPDLSHVRKYNCKESTRILQYFQRFLTTNKIKIIKPTKKSMIQSCQGPLKFQNPLSRKKCYKGTS